MPQLEVKPELDYQSEAYKDAYSRINAIVIEGEEEAFNNYNQLAELMPTDAEELVKLAKMEFKHKKGFDNSRNRENLQLYSRLHVKEMYSF